MNTLLRLTVFIIIANQIVFAQVISSTIIDKVTKEPIPFATIKFAENYGIITNEEGLFSFTMTEQLAIIDSLYVSSMGYENLSVALKPQIESVIYLQPSTIELGSVFVTNKNMTVDEIIEKVDENLSKNYSRDLTTKKLFFRQSDFSDFNKINVKYKKSTIKEFSKKFIDSVISIVPRKSDYYTEVLCEYSGDFLQQKLHITKAAELYDKANDGSMEVLSDRLLQILKDNVKPTSYLKIKSGWFFGTKVQMDSIFKNNKEASEVKEEVSTPKKDSVHYFTKSQKSTLKELFSNMFFQKDSKLNFIEKSGRYDFELVDFTSIGDLSVYVINFSPKRNEDFKGTLYVNTEDFAIVQLQYQNVQRIRNFHLLGIHYQETLYKGTTLFSKGNDGKYSLKYLEKTDGNTFEIDRPLKIIEMNKIVKGRNKQNELSLNMDIGVASNSRYEIVVFDEEPITQDTFDTTIENTALKPEYLSSYDPAFWQGYNIMEPNAAIREFKSSTP